MDALHEVVRLAGAGRVVRLTNRRPGDGAVGEYFVEPYRFHRGSNGPADARWQLEAERPARPTAGRLPASNASPPPPTAAVRSSRSSPVTLAGDLPSPGPATGGPAFKGSGDGPIAGMGDAENYFRQIEEAMLDGRVTEEEMSLAEALRRPVRDPRMRRPSTPASSPASCTRSSRTAGSATARSCTWQNVRAFLDRLGRAPARGGRYERRKILIRERVCPSSRGRLAHPGISGRISACSGPHNPSGRQASHIGMTFSLVLLH